MVNKLDNAILQQHQHCCTCSLHGCHHDTTTAFSQAKGYRYRADNLHQRYLLYTAARNDLAAAGSGCSNTSRHEPKGIRINQKMVSTVSRLLGGAFSIICFCRSMKLIPLLANSLLRLITESSLYFAIARSACTSSYLQVIRVSAQLRSERNENHWFKGQLRTLGERQSVRLPSWYSCELL